MKHRTDVLIEVTPCRSWKRPLAWVVVLTLVLNPLLVLAQNSEGSPILRAGDQVKLSVPGRPDLDTELILDQQGNVDIPQKAFLAVLKSGRDEK